MTGSVLMGLAVVVQRRVGLVIDASTGDVRCAIGITSCV